MAKRAERGKAYYMISAVSQKYNIHPQTLRLYEREGLLKPSRTEGNTRLYSEDDLRQRLPERLPDDLAAATDLAFWVVISERLDARRSQRRGWRARDAAPPPAPAPLRRTAPAPPRRTSARPRR